MYPEFTVADCVRSLLVETDTLFGMLPTGGPSTTPEIVNVNCEFAGIGAPVGDELWYRLLITNVQRLLLQDPPPFVR
jgi:hypothetical protein